MTLAEWVQYGAVAIAIAALTVKGKGMKKYVPVGLFASFYANAWCAVAATFDLWHYPSTIVPAFEHISVPANFIVVPVMAMFWVRYLPLRLTEQIAWAFLWTTGLTGLEFTAERYTDLLQYGDGYKWYHSYILWFFSWFIWYGFHLWLNDGRREVDSLFK
ncbi:MAG: CBO0543 family protein [Bacillota bacterium]